MKRLMILAVPLLIASGAAIAAEPGMAALTVATAANGEQTYTLSLQILALMTVLTLLPAALLMMTSSSCSRFCARHSVPRRRRPRRH